MNQRWRKWPNDNFGAVRWAIDGGPPLRLSGQTASDVWALLKPAGAVYVEIHADTADLALSDFLVWRNADGMAWVRIDEHCEHYGRDPARAGLTGDVGGFPDGEGGWFAVPAADAVTAEQASATLAYWLPGGAKWPGLAWD
ncbi:MAG: hypothetical protein U0744_03270 [Gemmataceae bacterium]